ncbi:hypothetical protein Kpol_1028p29 [Vanderwaltozyma polyspora DSM 70294]|uniref:ATP-dependent RNA helicase DBP6 n=1 Tax=Vanderwaltozyma polyspora (strain ATCC 22028 / DSM 70294 / BCRC 21397 / CBS 2163 / NBRC 10782 / NRRL Y-8283 / UCD 57-17) TaxID=436907 RepID=DBP6_VANPO|nr:uncharacterized protein Kpol_1028p29 [Vanderwaltozyma polyspora DSM 70294]A7TFZ9.1 RecName: Full=ATP-dependent RNA helicase DBP6 [Vanderwaltozyma polyspora DSM 70294]EDO18756.1 hypothetical protein Kpol_1028p29 [Vanderwaltozyma polyspora DSM 70294]
MFAVRFDPSQLVEESVEDEAPKKVIPLKRSKSDEEDESSEEETESSEDEEEKEKEEVADEDSMDVDDESSGDDDEEAEEGEVDAASDHPDKHNSVMSRFQQTLALQDKMDSESLVNENEEVNDENIVESHNLERIPQPAKVKESAVAPAAVSQYKSAAWLNTETIHYDSSMVRKFSDFEDQIDPKLLKNIQQNFSTDTFPIQSILLETLLPTLNFSYNITKKNFTRRVGDVLVNASTGSGKTLAYSIPILQILSKRTVNKLRALVIVPTKLLINQVYETFNNLAQGTSLIVSISKLENSLKEENKKLLQNEPDILITTPGRLVDHLQSGAVNLRNLKFLVLDEADRLLNQSFQNWCNELLNKLKTDKQDHMPGNIVKMVFSATLTTNTEKLHGLQFYNPKLFVMDSVKLYHLPRMLQEYNLHIPTAKTSYKPLFLLRLLSEINGSKMLVFVKSNESSLRLASLLSIMIEHKLGSQFDINSVNSNNTKAENRRIVNEFASNNNTSKVQVLITTDVMSRGVDINDITDVLNYDVPISSQQYIHRCGRTARAQSKGTAYNMLIGKGERTFWATHIDNDISRDIDGCQPQVWGQHDQQNQKDEGQEEEAQVLPLLTVDPETESIYKECLNSLKEKVDTNRK